MTDERLDQILKQALAPEIDESDITIKGKARVKTMKRNENRFVKSGYRVAAAIAGCVLLGSVSVYAACNYFGLLDFSKGSVEMIPEEAEGLIEKDIDQTATGEENNVFDCTVKEALCDKNTIMLVFEVSAKEKGKYLFVPTDAEESDDMGEWSTHSGVEAGEYASENNLTIACIGGGIINSEELGIASEGLDFRSVSDDVMDICIRCDKENGSNEMDAKLMAHARVLPDNEVVRSTFAFTMEDMSTANIVGYTATLQGEDDIDYTIDKANIIQTELRTYLDVTFRYNGMDGITFRVKDAAGGVIDTIGGSGIETNEDGTYHERLIMNKTDLDDEFIVEVYDYEKNEVYESYVLKAE